MEWCIILSISYFLSFLLRKKEDKSQQEPQRPKGLRKCWTFFRFITQKKLGWVRETKIDTKGRKSIKMDKGREREGSTERKKIKWN